MTSYTWPFLFKNKQTLSCGLLRSLSTVLTVGDIFFIIVFRPALKILVGEKSVSPDRAAQSSSCEPASLCWCWGHPAGACKRRVLKSSKDQQQLRQEISLILLQCRVLEGSRTFPFWLGEKKSLETLLFCAPVCWELCPSWTKFPPPPACRKSYHKNVENNHLKSYNERELIICIDSSGP